MHSNDTQQPAPARVALIGVSGYARVHLRVLEALQAEGLADIAAATVINRDEEAETCRRLEASGCRIFTDYKEMLSELSGRIELCCIPTGIAWHRPMTMDALNAGCHVLVEKPAAGTVADIEAMIAAQRTADRLVFVGFQDLFMHSLRSVKQQLIGGRIGRIRNIRAMASWPRPNSYYARNNWAGRIQSKGQLVYDSPANNALAHYLIGALYLAAPEPDAVAGVKAMEAEMYRAREIESFDTISARLTTHEGVPVTFTVTHCGGEEIEPMVEVQGEHDFLRWNVDRDFRFGNESAPIPSKHGDDIRREMFEAVLASIRGGPRIGCTLEMAREHTRVIEALHAYSSIHEIAPSHRAEGEIWGETFQTVRDIERALWKSFESGQLFSEIGTPWSHPPCSAVLNMQ